jgi:hypothetical protein
MFRNALIGAALIGLGISGAFVAGLTVGQRTAPLPSPTMTGPGPAVQFGGPGGAAPGAGGPQGGGAVTTGPVTAGTISRMEGDTVYVKGPDGKETRVTLGDQTRIQKQVDGTAADLKTGVQVAVQAQGRPGSDGTVTASTVSLLPEGANTALRDQRR